MTIVSRGSNGRPTVYVVHPDRDERAGLRDLFGQLDCTILDFASAQAFLSTYRSGAAGCLVLELPTACRLELLKRLRKTDADLPVIVLAEPGDVPTAVQTMRAGAATFIEKPYGRRVLLREISRFLE